MEAGYDVLSKDLCNQKDLATTKSLPKRVRAEIIDLHRALGGPAGYLDFTSGVWDFATADGLFIEFDEQLHFNRYRGLTLELPWRGRLPWSTAYAHFSIDHEDACLKAGSYSKKWTSTPTKTMLGQADPPGILGAHGSPRWKQRAIYDAVRDAYAVHTPGVALARVSIYDEIGGRGVRRALGKGGSGLDPVALRDFIAARTIP